MFRYFAIAVCVFALASAGFKKTNFKISAIAEQQSQASHNFEEISGHGGSENGGDFDGHGSSDDGKYASGAELTSLAHSSALQANQAVESQQNAGNQAAFGAKSSLASAAIGAAMTAQAALVGKQVIVQSLQRQVTDAEHQLEAEVGQLHQSQTAASAAGQAALQAQSTLDALSGALAASQGGTQLASKAATEAASASASQHSMVLEAKQRLGQISERLNTALYELHQTEEAAQKALSAAHVAQSNAAVAGAAVVSASQNSQSNSGGHDGDSENYHH